MKKKITIASIVLIFISAFSMPIESQASITSHNSSYCNGGPKKKTNARKTTKSTSRKSSSTLERSVLGTWYCLDNDPYIFNISFYKDHTYEQWTESRHDGTEVNKGTWRMSGNVIVMDGEVTFDGNKLKITGRKLTLISGINKGFVFERSEEQISKGEIEETIKESYLKRSEIIGTWYSSSWGLENKIVTFNNDGTGKYYGDEPRVVNFKWWIDEGYIRTDKEDAVGMFNIEGQMYSSMWEQLEKK